MPLRILLASLSIYFLLLFPVGAALQFPNPSLEEDTANIGIPDGWKVPAATVIKRDMVKKVHGRQSMRFEDGYILLNCDLSENNLAGLKLHITFHAAGIQGAQLGVIIGTMRQTPQSEKQWANSTILWNRPLTEEFKQQTINFTLPKNAVGKRIFFAVYRSNKKGVVWLDHFNLISSRPGRTLSPQERTLLNTVTREWSYLQQRHQCALAQEPQNNELKKIGEEINAVQTQIAMESPEVFHPDLEKKLLRHQIAINQVLASHQEYAAFLSDGYQRIDPAGVLPAVRPRTMTLSTLGNEYQAVGITVINGAPRKLNLPVRISCRNKTLINRIQLRRQVLMKNWYQKEKALTPDPLTLLAQDGESYVLPLNPGEIVKLYLNLKFNSGLEESEYPLLINLGKINLELQLKTSRANLPEEPFFANFQCVYTFLPMADQYAAQDMAEHYVTGIEFPEYPANLRFHADGSLATKDLSKMLPDQLIGIYQKHKIKMGLFWAGKYHKFQTKDGKMIPQTDQNGKLTPEWKNAYKNFLTAWHDAAKKNGWDDSNFLNWNLDELGTHEEFANPPGRNVRNGREIYEIAKKVLPEYPTLITAGFYTRYEDVREYIDSIDFFLPHWPMPESLSRFTTPDYNPRKTFFEKTLPLILEKRKKNNLTIWSYKVDAGKKEPEINARIYPLCAVALGFTGVGSWAYNCTTNYTSWDDTDGGLLDYIFVYDGNEKHPLNQTYNVTGEKIVPSIRWEAFRMGIQDAKILLYLKEKAQNNQCSPKQAQAVQKILRELDGYARKLDYNWDAINRISLQIRGLIK